MSKKTTKAIIGTQNDYVIGVKGNQKKLLNQIKEITNVEKNIISIATIKEKSKGREETRIVSVSNVLTGISTEWSGLKSITKTERIVVEKNTERKETAYHISSLSVDAFAFNTLNPQVNI